MKYLKVVLFFYFLCNAFHANAQNSKEEELLNSGYRSFYVGYYDNALKDYYKALKINPQSFKAYLLIGRLFKYRREYLKALESYNKATQIDPRNIEPFKSRADIYKETNKSDLGVAEYSEAIRLNPDSIRPYHWRGTLYFEKKDYNQAIRDFSKCISLDPQQKYEFSYRVYAYRAFCYKLTGLYDLAIKDCKESIRLKLYQKNAFSVIIPSLIRTQQFSQIKKYYDMSVLRANSINDNDFDDFGRKYDGYRQSYYYTMVGESLREDTFNWALSTLEKGVEEYETGKIKKDSIGYSDIISFKGYLLEKLNKAEEAKELYIESLALNPSQPEVKLALSLIGNSSQVISKIEERPSVSTIIETQDLSPPQITISSPNVTRGLKVVLKNRIISITGKAIDENGIFEVTINNKEANVDASGNFSANIPLAIGDNNLMVTATDAKMNKGSFNFTINRQAEEIIQPIETPIVIPNVAELKPEGKYYGLIIGVQDYQDERINDLDEPIADATNLYNSLLNNYTFEKENITLLKNPKRSDMFRSLESLSSKLKETDNLLIFYAGHGYWDASRNQGYWFPSDAGRDDRSSWLTNADLKEYISSIKSKHTLLISDACFSGGIFKSRAVMMGASRAIKELYDLPSRKAMTSGTLKEVPDKSVFIEYLVKRLNQNAEKYLSAEQLFSSFRTAVINNSLNGQVPQFGEIKEAGDEGGDFIFIKR